MLDRVNIVVLAVAVFYFVAEKWIHRDARSDSDPAIVGLGDSVALQVEYAGLDYQASVEPRQRFIDKALSLNPRSGEAYAALGMLRYRGGEWESAENAFLKAIKLSPNYASAYHWYSILLRRVSDRREESLPLMKRRFHWILLRRY